MGLLFPVHLKVGGNHRYLRLENCSKDSQYLVFSVLFIEFWVSTPLPQKYAQASCLLQKIELNPNIYLIAVSFLVYCAVKKLGLSSASVLIALAIPWQ